MKPIPYFIAIIVLLTFSTSYGDICAFDSRQFTQNDIPSDSDMEARPKDFIRLSWQNVELVDKNNLSKDVEWDDSSLNLIHNKEYRNRIRQNFKFLDIRELSLYQPGIRFDQKTQTWNIPFIVGTHYIDQSNSRISTFLSRLKAKGLNSTMSFCGVISFKATSDNQIWNFKIVGFDDNNWYEALPRWLVFGKLPGVYDYVDKVVLQVVANRVPLLWPEIYSKVGLHSRPAP